jgi:hypothetical protein
MGFGLLIDNRWIIAVKKTQNVKPTHRPRSHWSLAYDSDKAAANTRAAPAH